MIAQLLSRVFLAVILILFTNLGFAKTVGFIRVTISKVNPEHQTSVSLMVNGHKILSFSHANNNGSGLETALADEVLAKGKSTTLNADYGKLQQGCKFDFNLFFSLDQLSWISLGSYHAPTSSLDTLLPIGLCDGSEVCSNNPQIQNSLKEAKQKQIEQDKRNIDALNAWLQQALDNESRLKQEAAKRLADKKESILDEVPLNTDKITREIEDIASTSENELPKLNEASIEDSRQDQNAITANEMAAISMKQLPENLQQVYEQFGVDPTLVQTYFYGNWHNAVAWSDVSHGDLTVEEYWQFTRLGEAEQLNYLSNRHAHELESIRSVNYWGVAKQLSEIGLRMSPVGDLLDACEFITGREYCSADGGTLTSFERGAAAAGLVIGTGAFWRSTAQFLNLERKIGEVSAKILENTKKIGVDSPDSYSHYRKISKQIMTSDQDGVKILEELVHASEGVAPKLGNKFVTDLPDLVDPDYLEAFNGPIFKGTYEPGSVLFQAQRTGQTLPGNWFLPIKPIDAAHAEELAFIGKYGNDAGQIKAFIVKERISGYAGKITNGSGHQFYIPKGVPLEQVVEEVVF